MTGVHDPLHFGDRHPRRRHDGIESVPSCGRRDCRRDPPRRFTSAKSARNGPAHEAVVDDTRFLSFRRHGAVASRGEESFDARAASPDALGEVPADESHSISPVNLPLELTVLAHIG
jgi:hypothetical protein